MVSWLIGFLVKLLAYKLAVLCAIAEEARRKLFYGPPFPVAINPFDAIACAVHDVNPTPRPRNSLDLPGLIAPSDHVRFWRRLCVELGLSPIQISEVEPRINEFHIVQLAGIIHPDLGVAQWPTDRVATAWRNAQVFAVVRKTMVECLGVDPEQVTRSARLIPDLGAE
jgi:hypothetical protein